MVRLADSGDAEAVRHIWKECFHDTDGYIDLFFQKCGGFEKCLVNETDGEPVSMLHLLPQTLQQQGQKKKAQYIYAAATLPAHRGRGLMAELLRAASREGRKGRCEYTILMPATSELYAFYQKFGFETAFSIKSASFTRPKLERLAARGRVLEPLQNDSDRIVALRERIFQNAVLWSREASDYVSAEWVYGGGEILTFENGFLFFIQKKDRLCVKEFCGEDGCRRDMLATLLSRCGCERFEFSLYPDEDFFTVGRVRKAGMIKQEIKTGLSAGEWERPVYINMMLD